MSFDHVANACSAQSLHSANDSMFSEPEPVSSGGLNLNAQSLLGYVVLDSAGEFLAWAADVVTAKRRLDLEFVPGGYVERCDDGAKMANAPLQRLK